MVQAIFRSHLFQDPTDRGFEVPLTLALECTRSTPHRNWLQSTNLIVPTSYKATSNDDPAFALFVLYLQAGLVRFCRRNGSPPRNIRSANNGFHARPATRSLIASSGNVMAREPSCWKKMAAGWQSGWTESLRSSSSVVGPRS